MADPHWTNYIGMITGIIGAITGISGGFIALHSQRQNRENRLLSHRLELQMNTSSLTLNINRLRKTYDESLQAMRNASANGLLGAEELGAFEQKHSDNASQIERLWEPVPEYGGIDYSSLEEKELEDRLVAVHNKSEECALLTREYDIALDAIRKTAGS